MNRLLKPVLFFAFLLAVAVPLANASAQVEASALPPRYTQGSVSYLSGGIGSEQTAAIKAAASRYALAVMLSASEGGHGVFIASVPLSISDAKGTTLLDVVTDGPYLLVDLPAGIYTVRARYAEQDKTATVAIVAGKTAHVSLAWSTSAQ